MSTLSFIPLFETKSARVKGIAFHPRRSWVLAALHNGVLQLWDYRLRTLIDRFGEHDGPVRGVDFHPTQPLFVSGGDDYKVKVWNYKERRCLFTLLGHIDYIRTVQFHHEYPWILSASDDQCIRIWNWQSRQCIASLAGHGHYVMCARFHPTEDLVVSASLDQTVRIWNIAGLRKKNITPQHQQENDDLLSLQNDIFGNTDAFCLHTLTGHDRGVNWACFHPTSSYIVSGADDRTIKIWKMNGTKAYEQETLRVHHNNVSNIVFHPKEDIMISNSEDRTIRVFDMSSSKRQPLFVHKRDTDKFWILSVHPKLNIFAAGHDSGLVVFKLTKERPPSSIFREGLLLFIKDNAILQTTNTLKMLNLKTKEEQVLMTLRKSSSAGMSPRRIFSHPQSNIIIVFYTGENGSRYELLNVPKSGQTEVSQNARGGSALSIAWVKRDRFAVVTKANFIQITDVNTNEMTKKINAPHPIDKIFSAQTDALLLRADDKITLFDVQQERILGQLKVPHVKEVVWDNSGANTSGLLALICKGSVVLTNRKLESICSVIEILKVKSGAWDEFGTFIYSTLSHIKYILPSGDHGIVRTIDRPIYIVAVSNSTVHCLDRSGKAHALPVDSTEYMFKFALANKKYGDVAQMVKDSNLIGQSIIAYLQKKGYPEIALKFVKDEKTRFDLALQCSTANNIDIAMQSAINLNEKEMWTRLGQEALAQGNLKVVQRAYRQTLDFERLSHLYSITGNIKNLSKMMEIATSKRADVNAQFQNALLLGDVPSRIRLLLSAGQIQLAYMTAITHGLEDMAEQIRAKLQHISGSEEPLDLPGPMEGARLMMPPIPITRIDQQNWPVTRVYRGPLDDIVDGGDGRSISASTPEANTNVSAGAWGEDEDGLLDSEEELGQALDGEEKATIEEVKAKGEGWDGDEDGLELSGDDEELDTQASSTTGPSKSAAMSNVSLPSNGISRPDLWRKQSRLACHQVAAGRFEEAMRLLNQQIGVVQFAPLKEYFVKIYQSSTLQLLIHNALPSVPFYLEELTENTPIPRAILNVSQQLEQIQMAYSAFGDGNFTDSKKLFLSILQSLTLICARDIKEKETIEQLISICREYLLGLALEMSKRNLSKEENPNNVRIAELSAYFTHCELNDAHVQLTLKMAINLVAKIKNFSSVEDFARRLLDLNPPKALQELAEKGIKVAKQKGSSDFTKFNYDSRNPFVICGASLTPIYAGKPRIVCPYCNTSYQNNYLGSLCTICELAEVGKKGTGLEVMIKSKNMK